MVALWPDDNKEDKEKEAKEEQEQSLSFFPSRLKSLSFFPSRLTSSSPFSCKKLMREGLYVQSCLALLDIVSPF